MCVEYVFHVRPRSTIRFMESNRPFPLWMQYGSVMLTRFRWVLTGDALVLGLVFLYERISERPIPWSIYAGIVTACVVGVLLKQGYDHWKSARPKLKVPARAIYQGDFLPGEGFYFDIVNESLGTSVEDIRVSLTHIKPEQMLWLPVDLHTKHDRVGRFSLNPGEKKQVDLVASNRNDPQKTIFIWGSSLRDGIQVTIPAGKYQLTITVTAKNTAPTSAMFETWIGEDGHLKCIAL